MVDAWVNGEPERAKMAAKPPIFASSLKRIWKLRKLKIKK